MLIGLEILGRLTCRFRHFDGAQGYLQRIDDVRRDFVLDNKYVLELAVVGLRPEMAVGLDVDKLCGDTNRVAGLPDAAFEDMFDLQCLCDLRNWRVLVLERKRRGAGCNAQAFDLDQYIEQFFRDAVDRLTC